jgi:disease resistance protein RPS2
MIRARELWTALSVIKGVLILDNLWGHFLPDEVGIPLRTDGWKLLLTTRSAEICRKMDCQRIIKVESLSEGEAWDLFIYRLGRGGTFYPEIAESIVKECAGLPLGIMTMARSMKGVDGEYRWRDALLKLRRLEVGPSEMEAKVFRVLKFSYAQLNDSALQECFLHITLFPKGKIIWREYLIEYLIDEGIVKEMGSRYAQFDRDHTMLDQLEDASLLEGSRDDEDYRYVKMHDLIWDMAVKIMNESGGAMVQAGAQLTELPDVRWWREELLRVSLMENRIENIPTDFSPMCPRLSTLLLCRNYKLNLVEDSFFQHLIGLTVLDLSDTDIEKLPDSICHLTSLTALLLGWCAKLSYVPSLAKLKALEKLDLSYTGLEDLPEGMESLKDLRYLNLDRSLVGVLRSGILPKLSKLQFIRNLKLFSQLEEMKFPDYLIWKLWNATSVI